MGLRVAGCLLALQPCVGFMPGMASMRRPRSSPVLMQAERPGAGRERHVFLTGAHNAGKRTLGALVASRLHASYHELKDVDTLRQFVTNADESERRTVLACTCYDRAMECKELLEGVQKQGHLVIYISRHVEDQDLTSSSSSSTRPDDGWGMLPYRFTNIDYG
eukprot:767320-Hanusia_phi.AAC.6